jgi:hypothetical protein
MAAGVKELPEFPEGPDYALEGKILTGPRLLVHEL